MPVVKLAVGALDCKRSLLLCGGEANVLFILEYKRRQKLGRSNCYIWALIDKYTQSPTCPQ